MAKTPTGCPAVAGFVLCIFVAIFHIVALAVEWLRAEQYSVLFSSDPSQQLHFKTTELCVETSSGEECEPWSNEDANDFVNTQCDECDAKATFQGAAAMTFLAFFLTIFAMVFYIISFTCKKKWGAGITTAGILSCVAFLFSLIAIMVGITGKVHDINNWSLGTFAGLQLHLGGGWVVELIAMIVTIPMFTVGVCWTCCCTAKFAASAAPTAQPVVVQQVMQPGQYPPQQPGQYPPQQPGQYPPQQPGQYPPQQPVPVQYQPQPVMGQPLQQGYPQQQGVPMQQYPQQVGYPQAQQPVQGYPPKAM